MLSDVFVLDAISHAYNFCTANRIGQPYADGIERGTYEGHRDMSPVDRPDLVLDRAVFSNDICDPDITGHVLFKESHTDATIYHELPLFGYFRDGGSPLWVGEKMRERWPGRVFLYGGISPHQPDALDRIDELVEAHRISGIKLYPSDLIDGTLRTYRLDDEELLYPILERVRQRGLKTVAIHKAIVMGPVPIEPYRPFDVGAAARAFPEINFEIVHGGYAFMEETAALLAWHPNISVSMEGTSALLGRAPRRFLEIIGGLMAAGATDRILWAVGGLVLHSRWYEEAFWQLEMPEEFMNGYNFPPLTEETKRKILGLNAARLLGIDVETFRHETAGDGCAKPRQLARPWSGMSKHAA